jgi:hypothetical protein
MAGIAPILSVERFLQAANTGDLESMARIFGTAEGSIADRTGGPLGCAFKRMGSWIGLGDGCLSWSEIELRMNAIAVILQHDDYRVQEESPVPGRQRPTTQVSVDIQRGGEQFADVPFTVVQSADGRWLVEEIGLGVMMASGSVLDQFPQHAARAARMDEGHEMPPGSEARRVVDELDTSFAKGLQLGRNVRDPVGEVVQSWAVPRKKTLNWAFLAEWF